MPFYNIEKRSDGRDIYVVVLDAEKMIYEIEKQLKKVKFRGYQGRVDTLKTSLYQCGKYLKSCARNLGVVHL